MYIREHETRDINMSIGVNSGYDAAAAQRAAEEEARRRAEEEERRRAEEKKRAQEAQQEQERKAAEEAQQQEEQSVFEEEQNSGLKTQEIKNYDEWIQSLHDRGLRTTNIGNGEADFSDYGNALSTDLQQRILNSFDNDQDYVLQQNLAALFTDGNFEGQGDIMAKCKQMGIDVKCEYVSTSYIVDNKYNGVYNKDHATNGAIAVYTFSDGKGGEIVIADANGNGGLETEELFANEILSGIASDLKADASKNVKGSYSSNGGGNNVGKIMNSILNGKTKSFSDLVKALKDLENAADSEGEEVGDKKVISRASFDQMVREKAEELVEEDGLQYSVAYNKALDAVNKEYAV